MRHTTRSDLEFKAKQLGYDPDSDDTDSDLASIIKQHSSVTTSPFPHQSGTIASQNADGVP